MVEFKLLNLDWVASFAISLEGPNWRTCASDVAMFMDRILSQVGLTLPWFMETLKLKINARLH